MGTYKLGTTLGVDSVITLEHREFPGEVGTRMEACGATVGNAVVIRAQRVLFGPPVAADTIRVIAAVPTVVAKDR